MRALPNSLTSLHNFSSESATSAVSSANNSWFISNLFPIRTQPFQTYPKHPIYTIHLSHHPIIYTLNNQGDITQPCVNPTLTGNHSLTTIHHHPLYKPLTYRKPLTIHFYQDTFPTIYINCFRQFFSNSTHF